MQDHDYYLFLKDSKTGRRYRFCYIHFTKAACRSEPTPDRESSNLG